MDTNQMVTDLKKAFESHDKIQKNDAGEIVKISRTVVEKSVTDATGIDKNTQRQLANANGAAVDAAAMIAAEQLSTKIKAAKSAGDDPNDLSNTVKIDVSGDTHSLTVQAFKEGKTNGHDWKKYGGVAHRLHRGSISKEIAEKIAADMEKMIG